LYENSSASVEVVMQESIRADGIYLWHSSAMAEEMAEELVAALHASRVSAKQ